MKPPLANSPIGRGCLAANEGLVHRFRRGVRIGDRQSRGETELAHQFPVQLGAHIEQVLVRVRAGHWLLYERRSISASKISELS
jgi:hypothetical protein